MASDEFPPLLGGLLESLGAPLSESVDRILNLAIALVPQLRDSTRFLTSECILFTLVECGLRADAENGEFSTFERPVAYFAQALRIPDIEIYDKARDKFFHQDLEIPDFDTLVVDLDILPTEKVTRILRAASKSAIQRSEDGTIHAHDLIVALITAPKTVTQRFLSNELKIDLDGIRHIVDDYMSKTPAPPPVREDQVPLQMDHPATEDQLGRRAFARALARRLYRILEANQDAKVDDAFMVHLHAPWGAGKTSLLNFLNDELTQTPERDQYWGKKGTDDTRPWVVVTFNAWQHQHIRPPWWTFIDALYRQALDQMRSRPCSQWKLRVWENHWRLKVGRSRYIVVLVGILWMLALVIGGWFAWEMFVSNAVPETVGSDWKASGVVAERQPGGDDWREIGVFVERKPAASAWTDIKLVATTISALVALLTSFWGISKIIGGTLVGGSASSARAFVQSAQDPMEKLRKHFGEMVTRIGKPIIVSIDDLDRCHPEFVVTLLEGIQTLFRNANVVFVLAGDRRWIYTCFEKSYEAFKGEVKEPGRRLGYLFLEKAFQLSVALPNLSPTMRERYWKELLRVSPSETDQALDDARQAAQVELKELAPDEMFVALSKERASGVADIAFREQLVERMAARDVEEVTEHFLSAFAPLLEPNPRAMKRLINAYGLNEALAILGGVPIERPEVREQLVLWTIVLLRWPLLEACLERHPDIADRFIQGKGPIPSVKKQLPEDVVALLEEEEVRDVMTGNDRIHDKSVSAALDSEAIKTFAGLRSSASLVSSVA